MVHRSDGRVNVTAHPSPSYGKMKVEGSVDSDHKNDERMTDGHMLKEGWFGSRTNRVDTHRLTVLPSTRDTLLILLHYISYRIHSNNCMDVCMHVVCT